MIALFLVGGSGTRLRPFTYHTPKPFLPFGGEKSILEVQIEQLEEDLQKNSKTKLTKIILCAYEKLFTASYLEMLSEKFGHIEFKVSLETECQLGTGGPIGLAKSHLNENEDFICLNSDILCRFPISKMIDDHKAKNATATILLTDVEDPKRFGVVVTDESMKVKDFVEKPQTFISNRINAGVYIFSPKIVDFIPNLKSETSLEKEIFPQLVKNGVCFAVSLAAGSIWLDLGTVQDYLKGSLIFMKEFLHQKNIIPNETEIGKNVTLDSVIIIGKDVRILDNCTLKNCVIFSGSTIYQNSVVENCIVHWGSLIGPFAKYSGL